METYLYDALYRHEKSYWWSVSRRDMVIDMWKSVQHREAENVSILDVGCGTGAMLDILSEFGKAYGADNSEVAVRYCRNRMIGKTVVADMTSLPFGDGEFDLVTALDVVEHVDDDVTALGELHRVCSHDGLLLLTVPAFNFLWSSRDRRLGHKRRYDVAEIVRKMETAGFRINKVSYTNLSYFLPLYLVVRLKSALRMDVKTDIAEVPSALNRLLTGILALETILLRKMDFPFGVSIVCMARKSPNV